MTSYSYNGQIQETLSLPRAFETNDYRSIEHTRNLNTSIYKACFSTAANLGVGAKLFGSNERVGSYALRYSDDPSKVTEIDRLVTCAYFPHNPRFNYQIGHLVLMAVRLQSSVLPHLLHTVELDISTIDLLDLRFIKSSSQCISLVTMKLGKNVISDGEGGETINYVVRTLTGVDFDTAYGDTRINHEGETESAIKEARNILYDAQTFLGVLQNGLFPAYSKSTTIPLSQPCMTKLASYSETIENNRYTTTAHQLAGNLPTIN